MKKFWLVAWQEYKRRVLNRRFILVGLLGVPMVVLSMGVMVLVVFSMNFNDTTLGYVDHSGLLSDPVPAPAVKYPEKPVPLQAFPDEQAAQAALDDGQIQAYILLPADYRSSGSMVVMEGENYKSTSRLQFEDFLAVNLVRDMDATVGTRLRAGSTFITQAADGSRSISNSTWFNAILPMLAGIVFIIAMSSTGGYLLQAVVDEKENRTMEVIITSVSPNQFIAGKIIGDIGVGLTQIGLWSACILLPVLLLRDTISILGEIQLGKELWLIFLGVMLPVFITVSALMAAIGSTVTEAREGQQVVGLVIMPVWLPYMLSALFMTTPNSPLAVALSMIPLTAPMAMLLRSGLTIVPGWQIGLSSVIQVVCAVGAIWMAGKAFRLGMLRYGKRLKLREIFMRSQPVER